MGWQSDTAVHAHTHELLAWARKMDGSAFYWDADGLKKKKSSQQPCPSRREDLEGCEWFWKLGHWSCRSEEYKNWKNKQFSGSEMQATKEVWKISASPAGAFEVCDLVISFNWISLPNSVLPSSVFQLSIIWKWINTLIICWILSQCFLTSKW